MEPLDKLKKKRSTLRTATTKLFTKFETLMKEENKEIDNYSELLDQLKIKENALKSLNEEIEDAITIPKDYENDISISEDYNENIIKTKFQIKKQITHLGKNSVSNEESNSTVTNKIVNFKLPEIPLPKFSGKPEEWSTFKLQFDNIITSNEQLSDAQKMHYLSASLTNDAKVLQTTEDTFSSLFKALKDRYENERVIVDIHINSLLEAEKLTQPSAKDLRNLVDNVKKNIRALKVLNYNRNNFSDALILNIILQKLDKDTRKNYEMSISSNDVPKLDDLILFLEKRSQILENINKTIFVKPKLNQDRSFKPKSYFVKSNSLINSCGLCKQKHPIYKCDSFLKLNPLQRKEVVIKNKLCQNCLSSFHNIQQCKSKSSCVMCHARHNSLLHRNINNSPSIQENDVNHIQAHKLNPNAEEFYQQSETTQYVSPSLSCVSNENKSVILSTALVWVFNPLSGGYLKARIILDSGSMTNIVTSEFASRLGVPKRRLKIAISGLGGKEINVKYKINAKITNGNGTYETILDFLVVPKITDSLPVTQLNIGELKIPELLADPTFSTPGKIDMLLGAESFFEIIKSGEIRIPNTNLVFQNTVFGYIATGTIHSANQTQYCGFISQSQSIDECLEKFWQLETIDEPSKILSKEEEYCEEHYKRTYKRNDAGRYIVQMPTKDLNRLGDSKELATKRLNQLWKRLTRDKTMKSLYQQFMQEYLELRHMERVAESPYENSINEIYYHLPHHGILRPDKTTTKLRVVFNASAVTTSGYSLNDSLLKGEVKEDIFEIMTRFRVYRYAFTADIQKMFRQILIDPSQRDLLRIMWKTEENEEPVTYRLNTVTYGTSSAPFLAIRTLKQLSIDEASQFPLAAEVIKEDVYMDDILTGAHDLDTAKELQHQLCNMLETCGMTLHKWNSNSKELMNSQPFDVQEHNFSVNEESTIKTLGVIWKPIEDKFMFKISITEKASYNKRDVLSIIARLYDPLGLLGPIITRAKIFLQKLWLMKLNWEDEIPSPAAKEWTKFVSSLKLIENIGVDRYLLTDSYQNLVLLGFADASESAYGAVVYMQCTNPLNITTTKLIASKSRVAPLKTISIPRLELSACLLLSQLTEKVRLSLKLNVNDIRLHTDSTIAIAWINTPANKLKTYIGNRVAKIQTLTENYQWCHIPSHINPADVISRGLGPQELLKMTLWWEGPPNFQEPSDSNYNINISSDELYLQELKKTDNITLISVSEISFVNEILSITNNFLKLIRILSFIFRFLNNLRIPVRRHGPLTTEELQNAKTCLIRLVQEIEFRREIKTLEKGEVPIKGPISCLHPFLDKNKLLRVGGRLSNSDLSFDKKFPILLPKDHRLTLLIMTHFHLKYLHVGAQTLLYLVRQEFWPLSGRNTARKLVHDCVICFKNKPKCVTQIMGNLPLERIKPNSPFTNVGIDFCGPFYIRYKGQRKGIYHKCYVAIFICFVTKAVHIEAVTDLTAEAMIATLKRFFSRRGKSSSIFTDNATNFVGASSELKRLSNIIRKPPDVLAQYLTSEGISWNFIPPRSPNFGGLWEAGVKSFKYHLKRTVGNSRLTFEHFLTVITQIEAILNSRPLTPMSSDPNDFEILTPGHFLIGRPLNSIAEPDLTNERDNYLSQWQRLSKMVQFIWHKWKRDYLNNLQARHKWQFEKNNISPNSMVLLKDDNLPPCRWTMGRIESVVNGPDGKVRVVFVKTPQGIFKRGVSKLCLLPCQ